MNVMNKYITSKIKPTYSFYKFLILNTDKYNQDIIDILKELIGECEIINVKSKTVIFYFNNIDVNFNDLIHTINDDFYIDAKLFESGKVQFNDNNELYLLLDIYDKAKLDKIIYSSNRDILNYVIENDKSVINDIAPVILNKMIKDESLLMLANAMFENDLNVSVSAKNIYMHRNTVNYKLEQIKEETGLDIRKFKDAILMYQFLKMM